MDIITTRIKGRGNEHHQNMVSLSSIELRHTGHVVHWLWWGFGWGVVGAVGFVRVVNGLVGWLVD